MQHTQYVAIVGSGYIGLEFSDVYTVSDESCLSCHVIIISFVCASYVRCADAI